MQAKRGAMQTATDKREYKLAKKIKELLFNKIKGGYSVE